MAPTRGSTTQQGSWGHLLLMALRRMDGLGMSSTCSAQHIGFAATESLHLTVGLHHMAGQHGSLQSPYQEAAKFQFLTSPIPSYLKFNDFFLLLKARPIVVSWPRFLYIWYTCTLGPPADLPPPGFTLRPCSSPYAHHTSENSGSPFSSNLHRHSSQISSSRP